MALQLAEPTPAYSAQIMQYRNAFLQKGDRLDGTSGLGNYDTFAAWYTALCAMHSETTLPAGLVPSTTYLVLDETGALVGMIDLRHRLNEHLLQYGGHIGYSVHPNQRCKGYATEMLAQLLAICKARGMAKVLITCDKGNLASAKTILKNGGVLENEVPNGAKQTQRYWVAVG